MTAAVPDPQEDIDWSKHRGSCRIFYAERRCTCGAVPDPRFRDQLAEAPKPVATPGDLLVVLLRDRGMTQAALATMLGRPAQMVSEIVTGKKRVTATTAVQLQCVFGLPALVWLGLQAHTDLTPSVDRIAEVEARVQAAANQRAVEERIVAEATDLCWKATPFTEDEEGMVAAYLLPAGVVHRLLGALQGAGYPAAFRALASPAPAPRPAGKACRVVVDGDEDESFLVCLTCNPGAEVCCGHHLAPHDADGCHEMVATFKCQCARRPAPAPHAEEGQAGGFRRRPVDLTPAALDGTT